jgi:hypothetical protein
MKESLGTGEQVIADTYLMTMGSVACNFIEGAVNVDLSSIPAVTQSGYNGGKHVPGV